MKLLLRGSLFTIRGAVLVGCGLASLFLGASGYESVFNKPLPIVHSVLAVNLSAFSRSFNLDHGANFTAAGFGTFGRPVTLKLPATGVRLDIVTPIQDGNTFLARTSPLHLLIVEPPRAGNIGVALVYCRSSYRTVASGNLPAPGQNVFMDTDTSWRYVYKVINSGSYPETRPFVLADDGKTGSLILDCNDSATHTNLITTATLTSVQGIGQ